MDCLSIGQRIHDRRVELGLSVDELAAKIGKDRATVYRYERDEIDLPFSIIQFLCGALGTTASFLCGERIGLQSEIDQLFDQLNETGKAAAVAAVNGIFDQPQFRNTPRRTTWTY